MNNIKTNLLFFVLMALIFMAYVTISFIDPQDLLAWLIHHYELDVEKGRLLASYIQELTWIKIKGTLVLSFLFLLYLLYYDTNMVKEYRHAFYSFFRSIRKDLAAFSFQQRSFLFVLLGLFSGLLVWYSSRTPVQLDELHTWLFFIQRGPWITAAYYPSSNNHIAYNLLSMPWNFILPPVWALRSVSLLSALGTVLLFVLILKRKYNFILAVTGMVLFMSLASFSWYAVQGRGYVLELFFLTSILYILTQEPYDFTTDRLLVFFNTGAMYTVPIAIIPLALLNSYYACQLYRGGQPYIQRMVRTAVYSLVFIFLCYVPVGIFSGFEQLINNPFVQRVPYAEAFMTGLKIYLPGIWSFISGSEGGVSLALAAILLMVTGIQFLKRKTFVFFPSFVFLLPFLLLLGYPVLLFERTWLWLAVPFVYWCMETVCFFTSRCKRWTLVAAALFIVAIASVNVVRSYNTNQLLVHHFLAFRKLEQAIDVQLEGKVIRVDDDVLYDYLLFYKSEHKAYTLVYGKEETDGAADAFITGKENFNPSSGKVLWSDAEKVLYIRE